MRIAAIPVGDRGIASSRIRLYSLLEALPRGYTHSVVSDFENAEAALDGCDILYVQKAAWGPVVELARRALGAGKKVVYDVDDDFGVWPDMQEDVLCSLASVVTVDSAERAALLQPLTKAPVRVVPCMIDLADDPARRPPSVKERPAVVCTFGNNNSVAQAAPWLSALAGRDVSTFVIGPESSAVWVPQSRYTTFKLESFVRDLSEADLAVLAHQDDDFGNRKDNNRLVMAMSLGMPAMTSHTSAYVETLEDVGLPELACRTADDMLKTFDELAARGRRLEISSRFFEYAWSHYNPRRVAEIFARALSEAFA